MTEKNMTTNKFGRKETSIGKVVEINVRPRPHPNSSRGAGLSSCQVLLTLKMNI